MSFPSPLIPAKAGIQMTKLGVGDAVAIGSLGLTPSPTTWIPASAGMSGVWM